MSFLKIFCILVFLLTFFTTPTDAANKEIKVDLTTQTIFAYENSQLIYKFPISSGKWYPTPTGTYKPWVKLTSTRMVGGSPKHGTYYNLPNVPYVVYFYKGYAIHGAYWHNNFGQPMSHGCVNLAVDNAALIYKFIDYDTPITIFGHAPAPQSS